MICKKSFPLKSCLATVFMSVNERPVKVGFTLSGILKCQPLEYTSLPIWVDPLYVRTQMSISPELDLGKCRARSKDGVKDTLVPWFFPRSIHSLPKTLYQT